MRGRALVLLPPLLLLAAAAHAQQPARTGRPTAPAVAPPAASETFNVGVVDISAILRNSSAAQALQRRLQAEQERYQAQADQQQKALQAEEEAIERQRGSMSAEAYAQKRRELQEQVNRTTVEFRNRRRLIDEAFNNASAEINRTLMQVIEELAQERGIELVIRREAVLYQRQGKDLTREAGEALNQRLPEVQVDIPDSKP